MGLGRQSLLSAARLVSLEQRLGPMAGVQGYGVRPSKSGGVRGTVLYDGGVNAMWCVSRRRAWYFLWMLYAFLRLEKRRVDRREFVCHHVQGQTPRRTDY